MRVLAGMSSSESTSIEHRVVGLVWLRKALAIHGIGDDAKRLLRHILRICRRNLT